MKGLSSNILEVAPEGNVLVQLKERYLQTLIWTAVAVLVTVIFTDLLRNDLSVENLIMGVLIAVCVGLWALLTYGYVNLVGWLLLMLMVGMTFFYTDIRGLVPSTMALITAAVVLSRGPFLLVNVIVIGFRLVLLLQEIVVNGSADSNLFWLHFGPLATLAVVSITVRFFTQILETNVRRADRNVSLVRATNEIGQIATTILDLNQLFERSVELIKERFGFYHVQVFMVNGDAAELVASTGEVGKQLLANRHRLSVGSNSVIGRVTSYGMPVLVRSSDAIYRPNPLLPNTRSELAVPIRDGDQIIGALDMQSTQSSSFQIEDAEALQSMANLLAAAIRNARLFAEQQRVNQEQQRVNQEAEANLREIERLNRQLTRAGWEEFARQSAQMTGVNVQDARVVGDTTWTETLSEAARRGQVINKAANGSAGVVAVPVMLRGEVIGAIEVEAGDEAMQRDAVEMVQAIAQRLATSLENARLFEQSQAATTQEQRINQIVTRYQTATSVNDLLQITLTELSDALGAQRGAIRLGFVPEEAQPDRGAAS